MNIYISDCRFESCELEIVSSRWIYQFVSASTWSAINVWFVCSSKSGLKSRRAFKCSIIEKEKQFDSILIFSLFPIKLCCQELLNVSLWWSIDSKARQSVIIAHLSLASQLIKPPPSSKPQNIEFPSACVLAKVSLVKNVWRRLHRRCEDKRSPIAYEYGFQTMRRRKRENWWRFVCEDYLPSHVSLTSVSAALLNPI